VDGVWTQRQSAATNWFESRIDAMPKQLFRLEAQVLDMLLARDDPRVAVLREQRRDCRVRSREGFRYDAPWWVDDADDFTLSYFIDGEPPSLS
jgi:hypothetical protein